MKQIINQMRVELVRFRIWFALLWLLLGIQPWISSLNIPNTAFGALNLLLLLTEAGIITIVVVTMVQADSLLDTNAWWMTRPVTRPQLFAGKAGAIFMGIVLPAIIMNSIYWIYIGINAIDILAGILGLGFYVGTLIVGLGALASLSANISQFLLGCIIYFAAFMGWAIVKSHLLPKFIPIHTDWTGRFSAQVAAAGLWIFCMAITWLLQALAGWRRLAMATALAGILLYNHAYLYWPINFFDDREIPNDTVKIDVLTDEEILNPQKTNQIVWDCFKVSNLTSNQIATPREVNAVLHVGNNRLIVGDTKKTYSNIASVLGFHSWRNGSEFMKGIKPFFPDTVQWLTEYPMGHKRSLQIDQGLPSGLNYDSLKGVFQGETGLDVFEMKKVAELPLKPVSKNVLPGINVSIVETKATVRGLEIQLVERCMAPMVGLSYQDKARKRFMFKSQVELLYVLYNPRNNSACVCNPNSIFQLSTVLISQEKRLQFSWIIPPDFGDFHSGREEESLQDYRLYAFMADYLGYGRPSFFKNDYVFRQFRGLSNLRLTVQRSELHNKLTDHEEVGGIASQEYVDTIMELMRIGSDRMQHFELNRKLEALGPSAVPVLLRRMPRADDYEVSVTQFFLSQHLKREQIPILMKDYEQNPLDAWVFLKKGWIEEARVGTSRWIKQRKAPIPADVVILAAKLGDPALYADMMWHFAHMNRGHEAMLAELRTCPGFDVNSAVKLAWKRARLNYISKEGLVLAAAEEGLPDGLSSAILRLTENQYESEREKLSRQLADLVGYKGSDKNFGVWIVSNASRLVYDPKSKKYRL